MLEAQAEKNNRPAPRLRDLTLECRIKANQEAPKWQMNEASVKTSVYTDDTNPERLEARDRLRKRIELNEKRRSLEGTTTINQSGMPGGTMTSSFLPKQFIDPDKVRMRSVYMRTFGKERPGVTITMNREAPPPPDPPRTVKKNMLDSHWIPGWGTRKY